MTVVDPDPTAQRASGDTRGTLSQVDYRSKGGANKPDAPAKIRILETADRLFYSDGIRSVGIDRLIGESGVTKATFYKHWISKDRLILSYLEGRHYAIQAFVAELVATHDSPAVIIRSMNDAIVAELHRPGFRGCPFINAAAEYPDPSSPARIVVSTHRDWYVDTLESLLRQAGHPLPGDAADELMLARDGAMVGGYAGDPVSATAALRRIVDGIVGEPED